MESKRPEFIRGKSYDAMSTASLYALLETEMDETRDNIDVEKIDSILAVLNERTPLEPVDVDTAWNSFIHDYYTGDPLYPEQEDASTSSLESTTKQSEIQTKNQSSEKSFRKKRPVRMFLIAAVVVVLFGAITVSATNVWSVVLSWTSETFGLEFGIRERTVVRNPELTELAVALVDNDITAPLIPNYLPDGYTQSEIYMENNNYVGVYQKGNSEIFIRLRKINNQTGIQYEQDNGTPDFYEAGGIEHLISTNLGQYTAVWENGGYECSIQHVPSRAELVAMIDSIYLEE